MKRPFALLEVLIGLSLTAMIVSSLIVILRESVVAQNKIEKERRIVLQRVDCYQRLTQLFGSISIQKNGSNTFYLTEKEHEKNPTLIFKFENGIDLDPHYCGMLQGILFIESHTLYLQTLGTPLSESDKRALVRKEALLEGVEKIAYTFLHSGGISSTWNQDNVATPHYVKIEVKMLKGYTIAFSFWVKHEAQVVEI